MRRRGRRDLERSRRRPSAAIERLWCGSMSGLAGEHSVSCLSDRRPPRNSIPEFNRSFRRPLSTACLWRTFRVGSRSGCLYGSLPISHHSDLQRVSPSNFVQNVLDEGRTGHRCHRRGVFCRSEVSIEYSPEASNCPVSSVRANCASSTSRNRGHKWHSRIASLGAYSTGQGTT
jgi:hypothetical protein